ncbi:MAG: ABC transporter permease [Clostridia bacterium]|nr:ABC transporter permease [Clostridia bacterium]
MYIFKNALRCISRSKGRNILIGIIVLVIAVSACIGLSIRQAAENARKETLDGMSVTATISFDRQSAMSNMTPPTQGGDMSSPPEFDRSQFAEMMGSSSALTLEEYETYAKAQTVKDFYYSLSVSLDGDDNLLPVSSEDTQTEDDTENNKGGFGGMMPGGMGGFDRVMGAQSDFTVVGYSSETAMTDFINGTASVTTGEVFAEGTKDYECIISEELATYNNLSVGDSITVINPNSETESYILTVTGFYTDTTANENSFSMMGMTSNDPANKIYMSYNALQAMVEASEGVSETKTDEDTGREFETALTGTLSATYSFADVEGFEQFESDVREMGLDESYTVSSTDITAFENSLTPLTTLSKTAGYFLIVILIIGAVILVVLNIFSVRERKYEIGVLTAMGMKKTKVAMQFMAEIFMVTLVSVIIGAAVGAVASVPVANTLLENQTTAKEQQFQNMEQGFGRGDKGETGMPGNMGGMPQGGFMKDFIGNPTEYITEINSATDVTVLLQMLGIAVLLTLIAGMASMLFIMRYEPLRILSNRD